MNRDIVVHLVFGSITASLLLFAAYNSQNKPTTPPKPMTDISSDNDNKSGQGIGWTIRSEFRVVWFHDNYDGDTLTVDIKNIHPLLGQKIRIRVADIDTPEIRNKSACEKEIALKAKKLTHDFVSTAKKGPYLKNCKRGTFFRLVCDVEVDGRDLGDYLIAQKVAVAWDQRKGHVWCK